MTRTVVKIFLSKLSFRQLYAIGKSPLFSSSVRGQFVYTEFQSFSEVPGFWEFNFARLGSFLHCTIAIMPRTDDV